MYTHTLSAGKVDRAEIYSRIRSELHKRAWSEAWIYALIIQRTETVILYYRDTLASAYRGHAALAVIAHQRAGGNIVIAAYDYAAHFRMILDCLLKAVQIKSGARV